MKLKIPLTIFISVFFNFSILKSQDTRNLKLTFQPQYADSILHLGDHYYPLNDHDSLQFETLKFYISGIVLTDNKGAVWIENNSFHLLDASQEQGLQCNLDIPNNFNCKSVQFQIGIDSTTNVSGALGGDLDPTKGMYWTWQSGYINFKLEGKSNLCKTRNNEFQFHIGGYLYPFSCLQTIQLDLKPTEDPVIILDIKKMLASIDLSKQNQIMNTGLDAVKFSSLISNSFRVK